MKAVNAKAQRIMGTAYGVPLTLEKWQGKHDLLVVTLDDFDLILGLDFLKKAKIALMPYLGGILIASETCPSFVPCYKDSAAESKKGSSSMISAIAISKALRKGNEVYVAVAMGGDSGRSDQVPDVIASVLEEYGDVMPLELPKQLPPRRAVDH
jgi:hypothetical protein